MSSFLILLLIACFVVACIWLLRMGQRRRLLDTVERSAPLPTLANPTLPDFGAAATAFTLPEMPPLVADPIPDAEPPPLASDQFPAAAPADSAAAALAGRAIAAPDRETALEPGSESWVERIKVLRESRQTDAALALCKACAPRVQAFQQAAIILRGQIREQLDQRLPADALLLDLYRTAVLADIFRNSSPRKPTNPDATLAALVALDFPWQQIGHKQLKLLNKRDVRLLEQRWGVPAAHRHAEDVLEQLR